jgi:metal-responsive CopG/Arc/MetJ family transcriptional regulator
MKKQLSLTLNDKLVSVIDRASTNLSLNRSELIEKMLTEYINFRYWDAQNRFLK